MKNVATPEIKKEIKTIAYLVSHIVEVVANSDGNLTAKKIAIRTTFKKDYALKLINWAIENKLIVVGRYGHLTVA